VSGAGSVLDLVGRGVSKPSEIAARIGVPQGHLSRPLALLLDLGLLQRELPYGESTRSTKKVLYRVHDPSLSFYYGVVLPNRHRWPALSDAERRELTEGHVSRQWEVFCRSRFPGSARYWEGAVELDVVAPLTGGRTVVAECKWSAPDSKQRSVLLASLRERYFRSSLSRRLGEVEFRVLSQEDLGELARIEPP
jgi:DNA-binding transcriptional ArsR family regulator